MNAWEALALMAIGLITLALVAWEGRKFHSS